MRVFNERWNELENELGLGLPLNILSEVDIANKWRLRALNAEKLLNQPQLAIPKSIADIIDGYCKHNFTADKLIMMAYRDYQEFNDWIIKDWVKNDNIARAYLAGKALGVDLVKVGEG